MNLILGTANFNRDYGKRLEKDECFKILKKAEKLGIKTLATAFDYGKEIADEYGWDDRLHKQRPGIITWKNKTGITVDDVYVSELILKDSLLMAPFNPLNLRYLYLSKNNNFIARSVFCGGRLQRSNKEDIASLILGFLKSHEVKNIVFGVESIDELELIVREYEK